MTVTEQFQTLLAAARSSGIANLSKSIDPYLWGQFLGIGYDKYLHVAVSFFMTFFFYLIYRKDSVSAGETAIAICVLKEIFDLTIKQSFFSYQDLLADFVGILLLVLLVGIRRTKRVNV